MDFRSPRFDLDSIYGSGPIDEPFQYKRGTNGMGMLLNTLTGRPARAFAAYDGR